MWKVKNFGENLANVVFKYTEGELKIREATNDEPWGPHGSLLQEITQMTSYHEEFDQMMEMLSERIKDNEKNWRRVYKGLLVLDYIIKNGSVRVIDYWRGKIYILKKVERTKYVDDDGKDQSINLGHRSAEIISLLNDENRLRSERAKAITCTRRMVSLQNPNSDYYSENRYYDHEREGRTITDSIKGAVTNVVDKIQSKIRHSNKDDDDLEDEFKAGRYMHDDFNRGVSRTSGINNFNDDYYAGSIPDTLSSHKFNSKPDENEFGNFVGTSTQNKPMMTNANELFASNISVEKNNLANGPADLISFDSNLGNSHDDFFSPTNTPQFQNSSGIANATTPLPSYQSEMAGLFQTHGTPNMVPQQQDILSGLDMRKQSSYFLPNQQNTYRSPLMNNTVSPMQMTQSNIFGSEYSQPYSRQNPSSLSSIANNPPPPPSKTKQISTVDDMIRDSLESFSKPSKDSRQSSTFGNGNSYNSTAMNHQHGNYTRSNNSLF